MNRYQTAFSICLAGGPIMAGLMFLGGNAFSASIVFGLVTTFIALSGLHLGLWVENYQKEKTSMKISGWSWDQSGPPPKSPNFPD